MGRVNPLTDLSRSYLICLSQRGSRREGGHRGEGPHSYGSPGSEGNQRWRRGRRGSNRELEGCPDVPEDTRSPSRPRPPRPPPRRPVRSSTGETGLPPTFMSLNGRYILKRIKRTARPRLLAFPTFLDLSRIGRAARSPIFDVRPTFNRVPRVSGLRSAGESARGN